MAEGIISITVNGKTYTETSRFILANDWKCYGSEVTFVIRMGLLDRLRKRTALVSGFTIKIPSGIHISYFNDGLPVAVKHGSELTIKPHIKL